ncbi:MAG: efflux RND transporter permease subunit [Candidatus Krumholzibacteriota bacterium]|nr:efflux RND transporter permease subunit [Candidatus Krumholzibacteriota bacterium]
MPPHLCFHRRMKAAELGPTVSDLAETIRTMIDGTIVTRYRDGADYYDIRVVGPKDRFVSRGDVEEIPIVPVNGSEPIRVGDVAAVIPSTGPVEIISKNQVTQVAIEADVSGGDIAGALRELQAVIAGIDLPVGYEFDIGGTAEMMGDMKRTVLAVLAFAIFFSFLVLTVQFDSLTVPGLILAGLPFCLAGVVFMMSITGLPLGATVVIGVLVVVAATVNDGVLLLAYAREVEAERGLAGRQAVIEAAQVRFRPRLMTTMTTIAGFLPLALNLEEGGDMLQPMAVAAIGGLGMELFVALLLMPCLYVMASRS